MKLFLLVIAVCACVLGGVFAAIYFLNKAVNQADH